ncbi:MAG: hypothetical protein J7K26_03175 [Candidatus Aenigmarchaeota archaeon]|nr:hypothetical protein [Candidatus Aenigmarchaeota archaeon]
MKIKLTKWDKISIVFLIIFVLVMAYPIYRDKDECEVAKPGYECASAKDVMIENCEYWAKYDCDTSKDESLVQIEWYIDNLCDIASKHKELNLECHNLKLACNQISGKQLCPVY